MDWRRAKSVLIISFLMLNVLLGSQLWMEWQERMNRTVDWTTLPPETIAFMRDKNIRVDDSARIPTDTPVMRELTYSFVSRADRMPNQTVIYPPPETRIVFYEDELSASLGGIIPELDKYKLDQAASREGAFVLNRMDNGWPIFDVSLDLIYSDQRIMAYRQDLIELKPSGDTKEQQVLSAAKALAKVIEINLPHGSVIKEVSLGYHGEIFDEAELQLSTPSWRVLLENGEEVYYVNAFTAEVTTEKNSGTAGAV